MVVLHVHVQSMKNCVSIITGSNGEQSNLNKLVQ